ncbi:MAG: hypothetical protein L6Q92_09150 [Phycisphaerae bacterium]|nr:hypothetical protein [Phycisphaerae bacterium]
MISSIVSEVCSQLTSLFGQLPFVGEGLVSLISQVCEAIISALQGAGL